MKYAQLIIGLLLGTALGGAVVVGTGQTGVAGGATDAESVKKIVREVIADEPKLILDSVQKFQVDAQRQKMAGANEALKDADLRDKIFNDPNAPTVGPKDSKRVVAEFFDYNCGACKMMFKSIDAVLKKDPTTRVVFHEFPIFGPVSETNSKLGIAVSRLYADKYFAFHTKMLTHEGKIDEKAALGIAKDLGMDTAKLKAESQSKEVAEILDNHRKLGEKLGVQGTPTMVFENEIVPHGMSAEDLDARLSGKPAPAAN
jgi:protein-disulfide isomerase